MKPLTLRLFSLLLLLAIATLPAQANQRSDFSEAQLDSMLAPIALYPDTVLSHILIAATYPLEIVEADRWARANSGLEGEAAVNAADHQDWEPSVKALVAFPHILQRLSDDLAWTQQLGDAFLDDEAAVMDAIQRLRRKAYDAGSLDRLEHVKVQRDREVIVIEPAVERVVYVPVYDTRVVYGHWWWNDYPPVYWHYPSSYVFIHGFYWGPRIYVGPSFYFSSFHWHRRHVVYVDYRRYPQRPHFHTGRSIAHYRGAAHWRHDPIHRRGVAYHNDRVRQHYGSNRTSYSRTYENRGVTPRWQRESGQLRTGGARPEQPQNRYREADRVRQQLGNTPDNRNWRQGQGQEAQVNRETRKDPQRIDPQRDGQLRTNRESQIQGNTSRDNRQVDQTAREQARRFTGDQRPTQQTGPANTTQQSTSDPRPQRQATQREQRLGGQPAVQDSPNIQRTPEARNTSRNEVRSSRETSRPHVSPSRETSPRQTHRPQGGESRGASRQPRGQ